VHLVAKEINGSFTKNVTVKEKDKPWSSRPEDPVPAFKYLMDDGSTTGGCWIYSGSYTKEGNQMARRDDSDPTGLGLFPKWSWCWPVNRRIIYNRASVNPAGEPFNPKRSLIAWDGLEKEVERRCSRRPLAPHEGRQGGEIPLYHAAGRACPAVRAGYERRTFPEHYEPVESPSRNMMSSVQNSRGQDP